MHIGYESENTGDLIAGLSVGDKLWQFVRFAVVTGLFFIAAFLVINFQAYKTMAEAFLRPEAQAKAQEVLSGSVGAKKGDLAGEKLAIAALPAKPDLKPAYAWLDFPVTPTDNRLVIPKIGKSVPLVNLSAENIQGENWSELEKQIQDGLRQGVVHYPGTAKPGQYGNVFITGHSSYYPWDPGQYKDVFALLGQLEVGDRYYIYYNQVKYTYEVREKFEVQPSNVAVLEQPTDEKISTLMTCTPVGTTLRRLILKAEQV